MRTFDLVSTVRPRVVVPVARAAHAAVLPAVLAAGVTFVFTLAVVLVRPVDHAASQPATTALPPGRQQAEAVVPPTWINIARPFEAFDLAGGDIARLPLRYGAKRDPGGVALRDTLTFGTGAPGDTLFRVTLQRPGLASSAASSLFVDVARSAAELGRAVVRSGLPSLITTQFGPLEVADVTIADGQARSACLGFRLAAGSKGPVTVYGFGCGSREAPFRATELACTINRLDLVSAGDDEPLQAFFANAARQRGMRSGCDQGEPAGGRNPDVRAATLKGSLDR